MARHTLSDEQLVGLRADLEAEAVVAARQVSRSAAVARPVELDQTAVGRLSRVDAIQNQGLAAGAGERAQQYLAQIRDALSRLDDGTYGVCHQCGNPIPYDRLAVMPESRDCAPCSRGVS